MQTSLNYDFTLTENADFNEVLHLTHSDTGEDVDVSSWLGEMDIRPSVNSEILIIRLSSVNGRIVMSAGGLITLAITVEDVNELVFGDQAIDWVFDLFLTDDVGLKSRYMNGKVTALPATTEPE